MSRKITVLGSTGSIGRQSLEVIAACGMEAEALAELLEARGVPARACGTAGEGVRSALESAGRSGVVCALGSLYLSGDIRRAVEALSQ